MKTQSLFATSQEDLTESVYDIIIHRDRAKKIKEEMNTFLEKLK